MANGFFDQPLSRVAQTAMTPPVDPNAQRQMQNRQQGLLTGSVFPSPQQQGFQGGDLRQLYGLMALNADDATDVAKSYVAATQRQQQLDRENQPIEQFLRLYGNVNPYDFEASSLKKFHDHYVKTGGLDFGLLVRREDLSTHEQKVLTDSISNAQKTEMAMGRMQDLATRFEEAGRAGVFQGRVAGGLNEWLKSMLGSEDAVSQMRTEFEQLRISDVVGNLPPGVASDKDVALVLQGWPTGVSDPQYIAGFLRGMVKLKAVERAAAQHGASYVGLHRSQVGQLDDWNTNKD